MKSMCGVFSLIVFFHAALVCASAHALLIDDFTEGGVTLTAPLGGGTFSDLKTGLDPAHIAPTARHITFNAIDPFPFGDVGSVTVEVDTSGAGALRHLPDPGLVAANFFVSYGNTLLGLPAMSLNLTLDGGSRLAFDFGFTQPNPGGGSSSFAADLFLRSGNGVGFSNFTQIPTSSTPFTVDILFSDMLAASPSFDLTDVTEISFGTSNGTLRGPLELLRVYTIPEPTCLSLAILAFSLNLRLRLKR